MLIVKFFYPQNIRYQKEVERCKVAVIENMRKEGDRVYFDTPGTNNPTYIKLRPGFNVIESFSIVNPLTTL